MTQVNEDDLAGVTWFLRCASCGAMYVASEGLQWTTGTRVVYWAKPKPTRKPVKCTHEGNPERWNGEKWVPAKVSA